MSFTTEEEAQRDDVNKEASKQMQMEMKEDEEKCNNKEPAEGTVDTKLI